MPESIPFTFDHMHFRSCHQEPGHDRRPRAGSGILLCEIRTITPLCIHSVFRRPGTPYIPASSIRGMVRSTFEYLGAGCPRLMDDPPPEVSFRLASCLPLGACLACRTFGFTDGDFSWASKVMFADADPVSFAWSYYDLSRDAGGAAGQAGAWAVHPHFVPSLKGEAVSARHLTRCLPPGTAFRFRLDYLNLDQTELTLLLFALTLKLENEQLVHKLGYAKALGLGAVTIRILNSKSPSPNPQILAPFLETPGFQRFRDIRRLQ